MNIKKPKDLAELMEMIAAAKSSGSEVKFINTETGEEGDEGFLKALKEAAEISGGGKACPDCGEDHSVLKNSEWDHVPPTADTVNLLLNVLAAHQNPPKFKSGAFVRYRDDVKYVKGQTDLHVVLDVLDYSIHAWDYLGDQGIDSALSYRTYDVIIACAPGGGSKGVARYLADSRELELYPGADKLFGKSS